MAEIEISGARYRAGKLNARQQFHVARRLVPLMGSLVSLLPAPGPDGKRPALDPMAFLEPMANAVAGLSDADSDYIMDTCLRAVERQVPGGAWAPVATATGALMYDDMDLVAMLRLCAAVIQENLAGFLHAIPAPPPGGEGAA